MGGDKRQPLRSSFKIVHLVDDIAPLHQIEIQIVFYPTSC